MSARLLESFDEAPPPSAEDQAYESGYADGHAAAEQGFAADQARLSDLMVQNLKDLEFSFTEVRADMIRALGPLFAAICDKILPSIAGDLFAFHLAEVLHNAAQSAAPDSLVIAVHPDQLAAVATAARASGVSVTVQADPQLAQHALRHGAQEGTSVYDGDALLAAVAAVLENIAQPNERTQSHG